jgi:hypothetical protein
MDVWLGVGVVVVVLALSYFTPRRKCGSGGGGCQGCGSSCGQSGDRQMKKAEETVDSLSR